MESRIIIDILANIEGFSKGIEESVSKVDKFKEDINYYSDVAGDSLGKMGDRWKEIGGKIESAGGSLTKMVSLPVATLLGPSIAAAISYEDAFAGVRKTVDATEEEFQQLNDAIRRMSTEIPASVEELSEVVEIAGQLGIAVPDLEEFTEVAIALGVSTNLSAEQAATGLARLANIMGLADEDYRRMGSTIVDLGNKHATTESEIMNMTMRLAGAGETAGFTTPEIMGIATALSSVGIRAEAGGSSMSQLITSMSVAGTVGTGALKDLEKQTGMTSEELFLMSKNNQAEFKKLADALKMPVTEMNQMAQAGWDLKQMSDIAGMSMEEFAEKTKTAPAEALDAFIAGLANADAQGESTMEMLNRLGINQIRLRDNLLRSSSANELFSESIRVGNQAWEENIALQEEAEEKYATTASQLKIAWNAIKDIGITLGNALMPTIRDFAQWITKVARALNEANPKTLERIAKALGALVLVGPGLTVVGKAMGTFGTAFKMISGAKGVLGNFGEMMGVFNSIKEVPVGLAEKGWNKGLLTLLSNKINLDGAGLRDIETGELLPWDVDKAIDKVGGLSAPFEKASVSVFKFTENLRFNAVQLKKTITEQGLFNSVLGKTWESAKKLGTSNFMSGTILLALVGYLKKTYDSSAEFRAGLKGIWDTTKIVVGGFSELIGSFLDMFKPLGDLVKGFFNLDGVIGDVALALGGPLAFSFGLISGPIAIAVGAVGAISMALKYFGKDSAEAAYEQERFNSVTETFFEKLESQQPLFDKYSEENLPKLREELDKLYTTSAEGDIEIVKAESLKEQKELLMNAKDSTIEYLEGYYSESREALKAFHESENSDVRVHGTEMMILNQTLRNREIEEVEGIYERLSEINTLELTDKEKLTEDLIEEREGLYRRLDEITKRQKLKEEAERDLEIEMIKLHYKETGELSEKQANRLNELERERYEEAQADFLTASGAHLTNLKEALEKGEMTEKEYYDELQELAKTHYSISEETAQKHLIELADKFTDYSSEDFNRYKYYSELRQGQLDLEEGKETEFSKKYKEELDKRHGDEKIHWQASIKENAKSLETKLKDTLKHMDEMGVLPEEMALLVKDMNGKFDLSFIEKEFLKQKTKASTAGEEVGKAGGDGLVRGMSLREAAVRSASGRLGGIVDEALRNSMQVRSPSRVTTRIGEFLGDGLVVGMEARERDVAKASEELAKASMIDDITSQYSMGVQKVVSTKYSTDYTTELARTIAKTVANEVSKKPVRAYIGEDDFEEEVLDTVTREMIRGR